MSTKMIPAILAKNALAPMTLMPKDDRSVYWHVTLKLTHEEVAKLFSVALNDVNGHLEVSAHPLSEAGVQGIEDGFGEGVFIDGVVDGLSDAAVKGESKAVFGDGDLDLDHGTTSEAQALMPGN